MEDREATVAEMAELMAKMKHLYQQESWAKRQARGVAKRSPSERESDEDVRIMRGYRS